MDTFDRTTKGLGEVEVYTESDPDFALTDEKPKCSVCLDTGFYVNARGVQSAIPCNMHDEVKNDS